MASKPLRTGIAALALALPLYGSYYYRYPHTTERSPPEKVEDIIRVALSDANSHTIKGFDGLERYIPIEGLIYGIIFVKHKHIKTFGITIYAPDKKIMFTDLHAKGLCDEVAVLEEDKNAFFSFDTDCQHQYELELSTLHMHYVRTQFRPSYKMTR